LVCPSQRVETGEGVTAISSGTDEARSDLTPYAGVTTGTMSKRLLSQPAKDLARLSRAEILE